MTNANPTSDHLKGILITTLGVLILSPDALLIRLLDVETWTAVLWRGIAFAAGISILMLLMYREKTLKQFKNIGRAGLLIGLIFGVSSFFFTASIQNTSISNTLVIISTSPAFASLFSWLFLKEKVHLRTWIAMAVIFVAIILIVSKSLGSGSLLGDLFALGTSIFMAVSFTLTRRRKDINMVPAMVISGLVAATGGALMLSQTTKAYALPEASIPYLIIGGIVVTIAFALITLGPRYISAPEVSLIMPLETVMGSYLGWAFLSERPSNMTLIGGFVILLTLFIHAWLSLQAEKRRVAVLSS
ncbi:DMT family transporter [Cocleimonas sp. KMM 6892]|uniref:DMT family transporter n=1 Tax=unclassified Cocleimonas TaxID=2639732 RepID=UPI002DBF2E6D|nr:MULTISPECIES: DMT family transporter [unclassified Cocleimonas]MEB8433274.1 DMT family transporter [Cocleimonas sp. KMM 6892]MEC4717491.1 DMT family transporter [Cocleimonas sp. KMM 6895]MEC4745206.1 DMT family transporter [Cocleimonas sp. KMM 6896]